MQAHYIVMSIGYLVMIAMKLRQNGWSRKGYIFVFILTFTVDS